jgi:hypothetical protein
MADDLTWRGKLGFGGACAVCCAAPMLVVAGVVSTGAALAGGAAIGSLALVGLTTFRMVSGRAPQVTGPVRFAVAAAGLALAAGGLVVLRESVSPGRSLVSMGVAALASAAVLGLASAPTQEPR